MKQNKIIRIAGLILVVLSFYYIFLTIKNLNVDIETLQEIITLKFFIFVLLALFLYLCVIFINAYFWSFLVHKLSNLDIKKQYNDLLYVYAKSNLGKYLPGNIMQFVGRNFLGSKLGFTHSVIWLSSLIEIFYVLFYGAIILLLLILFKLTAFTIPDIPIQLTKAFGLLLVIMFVLFTFAIFYKKKVMKFMINNRIYKQFKNSIIVGGLVFFGVFTILGFSHFLLLMTLQIDVGVTDYFNMLFVFIASWIIGFIIPGASGGIGVREAIFISLASQHYEMLIVTLIPIIFRLINIVGDVLFYLINIFINKRMRKLQSNVVYSIRRK